MQRLDKGSYSFVSKFTYDPNKIGWVFVAEQGGYVAEQGGYFAKFTSYATSDERNKLNIDFERNSKDYSSLNDYRNYFIEQKHVYDLDKDTVCISGKIVHLLLDVKGGHAEPFTFYYLLQQLKQNKKLAITHEALNQFLKAIEECNILSFLEQYKAITKRNEKHLFDCWLEEDVLFYRNKGKLDRVIFDNASRGYRNQLYQLLISEPPKINVDLKNICEKLLTLLEQIIQETKMKEMQETKTKEIQENQLPELVDLSYLQEWPMSEAVTPIESFGSTATEEGATEKAPEKFEIIVGSARVSVPLPDNATLYQPTFNYNPDKKSFETRILRKDIYNRELTRKVENLNRRFGQPIFFIPSDETSDNTIVSAYSFIRVSEDAILQYFPEAKALGFTEQVFFEKVAAGQKLYLSIELLRKFSEIVDQAHSAQDLLERLSALLKEKGAYFETLIAWLTGKNFYSPREGGMVYAEENSIGSIRTKLLRYVDEDFFDNIRQRRKIRGSNTIHAKACHFFFTIYMHDQKQTPPPIPNPIPKQESEPAKFATASAAKLISQPASLFIRPKKKGLDNSENAGNQRKIRKKFVASPEEIEKVRGLLR